MRCVSRRAVELRATCITKGVEEGLQVTRGTVELHAECQARGVAKGLLATLWTRIEMLLIEICYKTCHLERLLDIEAGDKPFTISALESGSQERMTGGEYGDGHNSRHICAVNV